jgi:hypothetical protein
MVSGGSDKTCSRSSPAQLAARGHSPGQAGRPTAQAHTSGPHSQPATPCARIGRDIRKGPAHGRGESFPGPHHGGDRPRAGNRQHADRRPGSRAVAAAGLDQGARADPPRAQRRRAGQPAALGAHRHRDPHVRKRRGPQRRRRGRGRAAGGRACGRRARVGGRVRRRGGGRARRRLDHHGARAVRAALPGPRSAGPAPAGGGDPPRGPGRGVLARRLARGLRRRRPAPGRWLVHRPGRRTPLPGLGGRRHARLPDRPRGTGVTPGDRVRPGRRGAGLADRTRQRRRAPGDRAGCRTGAAAPGVSRLLARPARRATGGARAASASRLV